MIPIFSLFHLLPLLPISLGQLTPSVTYNPPNPTQALVPSTGSPNAQWSNVLGNTLWFYDAQRSGRLDNGSYPNRVGWRNDSALHDGDDWGVDLTGGWYDAGDYIKATFPLGFTMFALSWGALSYGQGYDAAKQTEYLDSTIRWGYDWLMKAHPEDDVLFLQVGSSVIDNDYWGGDQNIPTPRPAYPINSSSPGTDAWASTSSAFSLGALLYSGQVWNTTTSSSPPTSPSLTNSTYSALLLKHAETLYNVANSTRPFVSYDASVPEITDAYGSTGYWDDLCLSALSLAIATNQSKYYSDAYFWYTNSSLTNNQKIWSWDKRTVAAYVLFAETSVARPGLAQGAGLDVNVTGWQTEAEGYFDKILNGDFKDAHVTKGGLLYFGEDSADNSLQPALATATLMFRYAPLASSSDKTQAYNAFAQSQIDYILGNNAMSSVYIVGMHPNSPQNPSSAPASGGDNIEDVRNDPPVEAHVIYGGMVGGPLRNDKFWDWRDDWVQTEIALDYNANWPSVAAMMIANNSADPFYVSLAVRTYSTPSGQPCDNALPCHGTSKGKIAGIVVGVVLGVLLIIAGLVFWKRKQIARWWRRGYRLPKA
ncbi:endoglucanase [Tremella mesenterica]|uniref:Endoglucanase n=1 Tax=Tremella mesenterica TaxID=5217 RepID=A0A4Q1BBA7_TREME|nr:uncharacterized protein TREMEDRAFT_34790 [Tremella mesenterica DSM 1558]EIW66456.1 hypothetical protein TREMEDRAFT_34790 [Tremella mesenterica DSM 1558]RXK35006.1 endoglucanase [Tremella mesenterica]